MRCGSWILGYKINKEKVAGDWLKKVNGVRDLLVFQGSFLYLSTAGSVEGKKRKWREYSEAIAVRLEKDQGVRNFYAGGRQIGLRTGHHVHWREET